MFLQEQKIASKEEIIINLLSRASKKKTVIVEKTLSIMMRKMRLETKVIILILWLTLVIWISQDLKNNNKHHKVILALLEIKVLKTSYQTICHQVAPNQTPFQVSSMTFQVNLNHNSNNNHRLNNQLSMIHSLTLMHHW